MTFTQITPAEVEEGRQYVLRAKQNENVCFASKAVKNPRGVERRSFGSPIAPGEFYLCAGLMPVSLSDIVEIWRVDV